MNASVAMPLRLALIGNPNSGKTALFNLLTGSRQKVANYAGVTVERKEGRMRTPLGRELVVLDLPGAYSLHPASLDEAIARSQERQQAHREQQTRALRRLSGLFELILRSLLGDGVGARIELPGRGLGLRLLFHGDRHSAALDTLKIIAFDLAALCSGIEGHGRFPGLLIHDGPREADMSPDLYRRIFLYMRQVEVLWARGSMNGAPHGSALSADPPPFQYIITTTEPPPRELCEAPYLILPPLSAARPEGRLLGMDL